LCDKLDAMDDKKILRGVENIFPSKEAFLDILKNKKIKIYLGVDPTAPTLHLGHASVLRKLSLLQKLGHKVILLIGDFTGMIGDPTDKTAARKKLSKEEIKHNAKNYKKMASKFLDFKGENAAIIDKNSKWLSKMPIEEFIELASNVTYAQTIKRDMFQKRIAEGKDLLLHEFLYPLMQGYDSVAMDVDAEIGGNDQTFNMLVGRDLMRKLRNKEKFVIAMKLLVGGEGKKMGKTEGNMVAFDDSPEEMFGKIMSWADGMIIPAFELLTDEEIGPLKKRLADGENPKNLKTELALKIVRQFHGQTKAEKAMKDFTKVFSESSIPDKMDSVSVPRGTSLLEALLRANLISSKSEGRRLFEGAAITNMETKGKITDPNFTLAKELTVKVGKHRFIKIEIQE